MTNLDSIFKSRAITLPTKVRLVKAMVFPVVSAGGGRHSKSSQPLLASLGLSEDWLVNRLTFAAHLLCTKCWGHYLSTQPLDHLPQNPHSYSRGPTKPPDPGHPLSQSGSPDDLCAMGRA